MTRAAIIERRKAAAARAIARRHRQDYINERLDKPGRFEGMYKPKKLIIRRVK